MYHVTTRGVEKRPIVLDAIDADAWVTLLLDTARRYAWELDTWTLMPNHFHLLVLTWQPQLSDGMRRLNGLHAQRFNRRYDRSGHLFGGRFTAWVVETEEHLD
jgi:putative transposase